MLKKITFSSLIASIIIVVSVCPAFAFSNSTENNPAKWPDGSKMFCDIWLGKGNSFGVSGSTRFVPAGDKSNTEIYNKTSVRIHGINVSIAGLSYQNGPNETYSELTNNQGQRWAGISGTCSTDQFWYAYISGTSSGSVWYDCSPRTSSTTVTKWF